MPLTRIKSLGITDGAIVGADINSTFDLTGKTVTLPAGTGGKVLQIITATDSTDRTTTSTSFVTASNTLSVTITPSSSSNKIFIIASSSLTNDNGYQTYATIYRGATDLGAASSKGLSVLQVDGVITINAPLCITYLDSPSTTSATTYQVYVRTISGGNTVHLNGYNVKGSITAFEIAG